MTDDIRARIGTNVECPCGCKRAFTVTKKYPTQRYYDRGCASRKRTPEEWKVIQQQGLAARRKNVTERLDGMTDVQKVNYGYRRGFAKARWHYHYRHFLRHLRVCLAGAKPGRV